MAKKVNVEMDERVVQLKVEMDNLVKDIKELDYAIAELEEMYKVHQDQLKNKFEDKRYSLIRKQESLKTHLRGLFEQVPQSETKTQRKVKLLNADVVVKKPRPDFEKNIDKLLQWAEDNGREDLITRKEVVSFKWGEFKKDLVDTDYGIVDFKTGETLEIEGLVPIMKLEELEIKY